MYSRQNRNGREDISVELPRDYSGSAFTQFPQFREPPARDPRPQPPCEPKRNDECDECRERDECKREDGKREECEKKDECCKPEPIECPPHHDFPGLSGLKGILGGNIGLEELLLLGVIFLIFSDEDLRDNELLICLLLILFI